MPSIPGFTTKQNVADQLREHGVTVKLPFVVEGLKVTQEPLEKELLRDGNGEQLNYEKV